MDVGENGSGVASEAAAKIASIEQAVAIGASRGIEKLAAHTAGSLARFASALLTEKRPVIGIVSGHVIPSADPPVAETDGPVAAALLVRLFRLFGWPVFILTDDWCRSVVVPVLTEAGLPRDAVFVARCRAKSGVDEAPEGARAFAEAQGATYLLALERPGAGYDGRCRTMRGEDIGDYVFGFDDLFRRPSWRTAAFGDGGNEIGMGAISRPAIAQAITCGETIAAATPAQHTVLCGVSHWGAYALAAALAVLVPGRADEIRKAVSDEAECCLMDRMFATGAVDGTTGALSMSVDGFSVPALLAKKWQLFALTK